MAKGLVSPYKKAKRAGLKSIKQKIHLETDRGGIQSESCWDISSPRDAFDAHRLALEAQRYGSSIK